MLFEYELQVLLLCKWQETVVNVGQQFMRIESHRVQVHFACLQPVVIQQRSDEGQQVLGRTLHVRQVELLSPVVNQPDEEVDVTDDGAGRGLDVVGDGQHQFLAGHQQVLGIELGFFQFFPVMVVAGDVTGDDDREYQYQGKGGDGDFGHGFGCFLPYFFLLCQFEAGRFLFVLLNVLQQLVDTLAEAASDDAQVVDLSVQHFRFFLSGLEYLVLYTRNHVADGIDRVVHFIERISIFFLYHVAHLRGIFFSRCKHICQSFEEPFLFVVDGVGVMVRDDFSPDMRCAEQGILLGNQAVQLFLINLVGRGIPHGFQ